jgi:hypothetical protein
MAERSGWIREAEQLFLGLPTERKIAATGRQKLRGKFRWLAAFGNTLDDRGREKGQANHPTDIALADAFPLANLDHRSRATRDQIVKPAAGARRRLQNRGVDPRRGTRATADDEAHLIPAAPHAQRYLTRDR